MNLKLTPAQIEKLVLNDSAEYGSIGDGYDCYWFYIPVRTIPWWPERCRGAKGAEICVTVSHGTGEPIIECTASPIKGKSSIISYDVRGIELTEEQEKAFIQRIKEAR